MVVSVADMRSKLVILTVALVVALLLGACTLLFHDFEPQDGIIRGRYVTIETTAYCSCGICCDWKYNLLRQPVHSKGRHAGKPKAVGITASGTKAKPGTLAADTRYYPFGTVFISPATATALLKTAAATSKGVTGSTCTTTPIRKPAGGAAKKCKPSSSRPAPPPSPKTRPRPANRTTPPSPDT